MVVVSIDRELGEDADITRLLESMLTPGGRRMRWIGSVVDPGAEWEVHIREDEVLRGHRAAPEDRGHERYHVRAITVQPGTEWLAIAVLRLSARQVDGNAILATRWPRFGIAAALSGYLTPRGHELLATRAIGAGTDPHRVAVIDTPFRAPPDVNVVVSISDEATPLTGTYRHGAAVCSLILGASPNATIDHYPVLRGDDGSGVDGLSVFGALSVVKSRAANGDHVDVVNLSLTTPKTSFPEAVEEQLTRILTDIYDASQGRTIFVAATGNHGGRMGLPARLVGVLGVGCTEPDGSLWPRSAGGAKASRSVGQYGWLVATGVGLVDREDGTSYAAASVAGLLARAISTGVPAWRAVEDLQQQADRDFDGYTPDTYGAGRVVDP